MSGELNVAVNLGRKTERLRLIQHTDHNIRMEGGYYEGGVYVFKGASMTYGVTTKRAPHGEVTGLSVSDREGNVVGRVVLVPKPEHRERREA